MTKKLKILLLTNVLLAVAIVLVGVMNLRPYSTTSEDLPSFAMTDSAGVDKMLFGNTLLQRQPLGSWLVNGKLVADELMIEQLLGLLQKIEVKRTLTPQAQQEAVVLLAQKGIAIQLFIGEQIHKSFRVLVKDNETIAQLPEQVPYSIYVPTSNALLGDIFSLEEQEWRSRTLISTGWQSLKNFTLSYPKNPMYSVSIQFDTMAYQQKSPFFFKLEGVKTVDSVMVFRYIEALNSVRAMRYVNNPTLRDSLQGQEPFCVMTVEDLNPKRNNTIRLYSVHNQLFAITSATSELALLDTRYFTKYLLRRKDFEQTQRP